MDPVWLGYPMDLEKTGRLHQLLGRLDTIVGGRRRSIEELETLVESFPPEDDDILAAKAAPAWCSKARAAELPGMYLDLDQITGDGLYRRMAMDAAKKHPDKAHELIERLCKPHGIVLDSMLDKVEFLANSIREDNHQLWRPHMTLYSLAPSHEPYRAAAEGVLRGIKDDVQRALANIEFFAISRDTSVLEYAESFIASLEQPRTTDVKKECAGMLRNKIAHAYLRHGDLERAIQEACAIPIRYWEKRTRLEVSGWTRDLNQWSSAKTIDCGHPGNWDFKDIADQALLEMIRREAKAKNMGIVDKLQERLGYSHNRIIARCILFDYLPTTVHTLRHMNENLTECDNIDDPHYRDRGNCEYAIALTTLDCNELTSGPCVLPRARTLAKLITDPPLRCKAFARICALRGNHRDHRES